MLSLAAAAWAPLRTVSQKVSPGAACVIIATVIRGVEALSAEMSFPASSAFLPPEPLGHPAPSRAAATAAVVAVRLVEPQRVDRQVPLEVGLLVDGPLDLAGLDGADRVLVEVEGGELGLAARLGDGLDGGHRERGAERGDVVDGGVRL